MCRLPAPHMSPALLYSPCSVFVNHQPEIPVARRRFCSVGSDGTLTVFCRCIQRNHTAHMLTFHALDCRVKIGQVSSGTIFYIDGCGIIFTQKVRSYLRPCLCKILLIEKRRKIKNHTWYWWVRVSGHSWDTSFMLTRSTSSDSFSSTIRFRSKYIVPRNALHIFSKSKTCGGKARRVGWLLYCRPSCHIQIVHRSLQTTHKWRSALTG